MKKTDIQKLQKELTKIEQRRSEINRKLDYELKYSVVEEIKKHIGHWLVANECHYKIICQTTDTRFEVLKFTSYSIMGFSFEVEEVSANELKLFKYSGKSTPLEVGDKFRHVYDLITQR